MVFREGRSAGRGQASDDPFARRGSVAAVLEQVCLAFLIIPAEPNGDDSARMISRGQRALRPVRLAEQCDADQRRKTTEVSRKAATAAIGAWVIARTTIA
jgi:hypothetical protein